MQGEKVSVAGPPAVAAWLTRINLMAVVTPLVRVTGVFVAHCSFSPTQEPRRMPTVDHMNQHTLNNGINIPALGLGVFQTPGRRLRGATHLGP